MVAGTRRFGSTELLRSNQFLNDTLLVCLIISTIVVLVTTISSPEAEIVNKRFQQIGKVVIFCARPFWFFFSMLCFSTFAI